MSIALQQKNNHRVLVEGVDEVEGVDQLQVVVLKILVWEKIPQVVYMILTVLSKIELSDWL